MLDHLKDLYPDDYEKLYEQINELTDKYKTSARIERKELNEKDCMLITYGDSLTREGEKPLKTFRKFANQYIKGNISAIHFLPIYPYTSDDGFSVVDYRKVNEELGDWEDIEVIVKDGFDIMLDAVVNHVSKSSHYVQEYLKGNPDYKDYFIDSNPALDYSNVIRPRALPLLHPYQHRDKVKYLWTTFSEDQLDLNIKNPKVLLEVLDVLLGYAAHGARYIRLDAIGVIWKELGTKCMHLPQTHKVIKIMRSVLDSCYEVKIITETNVPHEDNISYFGNGNDEASLVYQFPLPPLTMYSLLSGDASCLTEWAKQLDNRMENTAFFNFLSSHDGIGVRPVEGVLNKDELQLLLDHTLKNGGRINYRNLPDNTVAPYELNINYLNAVTNNDDNLMTKTKKFMAAQSILLSMAGVPGIYIHSLLGSENDAKGMIESGINRRINREKLDADKVMEELKDTTSLRHHIYTNLTRLIKIRTNQDAFNPHSYQEVLEYGKGIFALRRKSVNQEIIYAVNVTNSSLQIPVEFSGTDLVSGRKIDTPQYELTPYQFIWLNK